MSRQNSQQMDRELIQLIAASDRSEARFARIAESLAAGIEWADEFADLPVWEPQSAGLALVASALLNDANVFPFGKRMSVNISASWKADFLSVRWSTTGPLRGNLWLAVLDPVERAPYLWADLGLPRSSSQSLDVRTADYGFDPTKNAWAVALHLSPP